MDEAKDLMGRLERGVMLCRGVFEECGTQPLNDSKSEVLEVCECIEDILKYRIKDNSSTCGEDKDYWNFLSESLAHTTNSPGFARVNKAVVTVSSLTHLETPLGKGRALIRWALMYKMLAEVIQHALDDSSYVNNWYIEDSIMLDNAYTNQLIQFLVDLQEIQFHLPSHGHDLDSHWPTQTNPYDVILVNGSLRISSSDVPDRPSTPVPKQVPPPHSHSVPCLSHDTSLDSIALEMSIPSEIRLVTSTLKDLKLLINSIYEKALTTEIEPPAQYNHVRRNTLAHASLGSKARIHTRSGVTGVETASKLDRLETILTRLAEKEDTRDEIHLLEKSKLDLEEDLRRSKNRNLDLQLQLTETLNQSETSDAELLQELGELQEALRQAQDAEQHTLSVYRQLEQQLNEREVEFEINQELLTQADMERNDLKERYIYMQEELEEKCFQLDELTDELNSMQGGEQISEDIEVEHPANSSSNGILIQDLQDSLNDKEGELTRSRKEQQQMNTVIQAMRDERGRLQKECLELRAQLPALEKKNKEKDGKLNQLEAKLTNFESYEEQKLELKHLQNKYKELQSTHIQSNSAYNEQITALDFQISSQKIELEDMKAKYFNSQSQMSILQNELDELKNKFSETESELVLKRNTLNSCQVEIESCKNEISQLKERNTSAFSSSAVDFEKLSRENSELSKQFSLLQDENETLRDTVLRFTEQKLALFNRADELEQELEKLFLAKWIEDLNIRSCVLCRRSFSNSLRKHHCRLCGKVLCNECSREKVLTPTGRDTVRCCVVCADFRTRFLANAHKSKDIVNNNTTSQLGYKKQSSRDSFLSITSVGEMQEVNISQSMESNYTRSSLSRSSFDHKSTGSNYLSMLDDVRVNSINSDAPYECLVGDYSEIIVHPKRAHCEDIIVSSGMTIVWEFVTERPIQFRLTFRPSAIIGVDCKEYDVIPFTSYGSTNKELPHVGHYAVEKAGVYRLVFSNETSILQSRKISYKVKLTNTHKYT
ncbi:FYVE and coiled-coil domain-containing protein 1-like [Oopsacas minuta]|uniref:FYVE and coiled-coil domain-containing protein 1-like n=1 Tax=Oopsacas minuta TaxID=111878 RepID=A0AAV7K9K1_9METZ|nr:FYVE and coiled-coil domain-containing protein 1-like [Oopsacas minuta]